MSDPEKRRNGETENRELRIESGMGRVHIPVRMWLPYGRCVLAINVQLPKLYTEIIKEFHRAEVFGYFKILFEDIL